MRNTTDYDFPDGWGLYTQKQKSDWFVRERVFRQACRQETTAFARRYQQVQEDKARLDTDQYRFDGDE